MAERGEGAAWAKRGANEWVLAVVRGIGKGGGGWASAGVGRAEGSESHGKNKKRGRDKGIRPNGFWGF